jgi:hypothetical protein
VEFTVRTSSHHVWHQIACLQLKKKGGLRFGCQSQMEQLANSISHFARVGKVGNIKKDVEDASLTQKTLVNHLLYVPLGGKLLF